MVLSNNLELLFLLDQHETFLWPWTFIDVAPDIQQDLCLSRYLWTSNIFKIVFYTYWVLTMVFTREPAAADPTFQPWSFIAVVLDSQPFTRKRQKPCFLCTKNVCGYLYWRLVVRFKLQHQIDRSNPKFLLLLLLALNWYKVPYPGLGRGKILTSYKDSILGAGHEIEITTWVATLDPAFQPWILVAIAPGTRLVQDSWPCWKWKRKQASFLKTISLYIWIAKKSKDWNRFFPETFHIVTELLFAIKRVALTGLSSKTRQDKI